MPRRTHRLASAAAALGLLLAAGAPRAFADLPDPSVHVVQAGETLWQIAQDAGVDASALVALNGLDDPNAIFAGQALKLPAESASAPPAPPATTYTVTEGDTLSAIAAQFGVPLEAIVQANGLEDADRLTAGAQLVIPGAPAPPAATPASNPAPTASTAPRPRSLLVPYTVQPGETLGAIARQFGVTVAAVADANGLDDPNRVVAGKVLKVPVPGREHVVQEGETLYAIAAQEKVDLGSLIDFNEVANPELIRVGEVLLIPAARTQGQAAAAASAKPTAPAPPPAPARGDRAAPADGLAAAAMQLVGRPYRWGGSDPSGFDCSGLVWYVARQAGKPLPRGLQGQFNSGAHPARDKLQPGDLVFFQNTYMPGLSHNGIYIGNGRFIHAADERSGVTISSMGSEYWSSRYFGATRVN